MISFELARRLHDSGLEWLPNEGDRFMIPDRDLEDQVFSISEMTIDTHQEVGGRVILFNGTVEWALDSIMEREVIWLPSETQLRDRLGDAFQSLERTEDGYRCTVQVGRETRRYVSAVPADAYGMALLEILDQPEEMMRLILGEM